MRERWGGTLSSVGARKPTWKPGYALIWTNDAAARLVERLAPHLRVKSRQAKALLDFVDHIRRCHRTRNRHGQLQPLSAWELRTRRTMYRRLKLLNARGPPSDALLRHLRESGRPRPGKENVSPNYLAGFVDAEGALMITKSKSWRYPSPQYRARASVSNTDRTVLECVRRAYGGILTHQPSRQPGWKPSYQLVWTDQRVERLLSTVAPRLRLKRKQATLMRRFLRHKRRTLRRRTGQNGRYFAPLSETVLSVRESLYRRMKALNAKGPALGESGDKEPRAAAAGIRTSLHAGANANASQSRPIASTRGQRACGG